MSEIYFTPRPCHPYADPYHDGHAHFHTDIPLGDTGFEIIDSLWFHCRPCSEPEIVHFVEVKPREFEIELYQKEWV